MVHREIVLSLMLCVYILNAFADAIDHGKGAYNLKMIWHIVKFLHLNVPTGCILYLLKASYIEWFVGFLCFWILWRYSYRLFRFINVYKLDDKYNNKWLKWIWGY